MFRGCQGKQATKSVHNNEKQKTEDKKGVPLSNVRVCVYTWNIQESVHLFFSLLKPGKRTRVDFCLLCCVRRKTCSWYAEVGCLELHCLLLVTCTVLCVRSALLRVVPQSQRNEKQKKEKVTACFALRALFFDECKRGKRESRGPYVPSKRDLLP